jgi:lipid A 3-O-deacylase
MFVRHVKGLLRLSGCAVVVSLLVSSASATEIRMGAYAHDLKVFTPAMEESGVDFNAEVLFDSPGWLDWLGAPRPQLGATIARHGTSLTYAGLDWTVDLSDAVFADLGLGAAIHDGRLSGYAPNENRYGCRANFHENFSIGYRLGSGVSVMASIEHMSNLALCEYNEGLTNAGVRLGYSF